VATVPLTTSISLADVQAVVLENDGEWSVIPRGNARDLSALEGLDIPGHGPLDRGNGPQPRVERSGAPHHQPPSTAGPV